jgi:hypothetical protein
MTQTQESGLFPTAVRHPVSAPDFDCAARVVDPEAAKISLPRQLSPRIQNRSLVESLKRDTSIRVSPRNRTRVPAAPEPDTPPAFTALPRLNPRNRPGQELSAEAEDALEEVDALPDDDPEVLRSVADELRVERDHVGDQGNYVRAQHCHDTMEQVETKLQAAEERARQVGLARAMSNRHQELEKVVSGHVDKWQDDFNRFRDAAEADLAARQEAHAEELAALDSNAPKAIGIEFRKRSPRLLALRTKETRLVLTKRFAEAERVRGEADGQEDAEVATAMERTRQYHLFKRKRLVQEHEREMHALLTHTEGTRQTFVTTRDHKISGYLARMNAIDRDLGYRLQAIKARQDEICDPEPDQERVGHAVRAERTPVEGFPRVEMPSSATRTRSTPRTRRRGIRNVLPMKQEHVLRRATD